MSEGKTQEPTGLASGDLPADTRTSTQSGGETMGWPLYVLWEKYEGIAMHFNDLIIRLRTQALGTVAAIATVVTILSKSGQLETFNWPMLTAVFFFLCVFWVAIWLLDFKYYNRLLLGAVYALMEIELRSKVQSSTQFIDLSTKIELAAAGDFDELKKVPQDLRRSLKQAGESDQEEFVLRGSGGRGGFYRIVFYGLVAAFVVAFVNLLAQLYLA